VILLIHSEMNKTRCHSTAPAREHLSSLFLGCILLAFCTLAGGGCKSTSKPASASFASVTITGNTPGQISGVAVDVFHANGYKVAQREPDNLVFEKEGSKMNNFAYGNWLGDVPVWIRVKAAVVQIGEMTYRLQCSAYMVRDIRSSTEEEVALSNLRSGPYQKMLDDVGARLRKP
jgi:hypothetical protein